MKKISLISLFLIASMVMFSCASKQAVAEVEEPVAEVIIPLFDDWEYKGFGNELPAWVEPAYCDNQEALNLCFPEQAVVVTKNFGINSDMSLSASNLELQALEGWLMLDEIWVRVNPEYQVLEEPYVTLKVYNDNSVKQ